MSARARRRETAWELFMLGVLLGSVARVLDTPLAGMALIAAIGIGAIVLADRAQQHAYRLGGRETAITSHEARCVLTALTFGDPAGAGPCDGGPAPDPSLEAAKAKLREIAGGTA